MKKVYEGIVYDVVPKSDGIIFFCRESEEDNVCVKMLSTSDGRLMDADLYAYVRCKLGTNANRVVKYCNNYVLDHILPLGNGETFICTEDGQANILGADGLSYWSGEIKYRGSAPSDIAFYKNSIWASFKNSNVLIRFNVKNMNSEIRIGGRTSPFDEPENMFVEGEWAYVCNSGQNRLIRVNLDSYAVEDYYGFEEPVHAYVKSCNYEFVVLDSGLYVI